MVKCLPLRHYAVISRTFTGHGGVQEDVRGVKVHFFRHLPRVPLLYSIFFLLGDGTEGAAADDDGGR